MSSDTLSGMGRPKSPKLTPSQVYALQQVIGANRRARLRAEEHLVERLRAIIDAGAPRNSVADYLGISRQTLYAWLEGKTPAEPKTRDE